MATKSFEARTQAEAHLKADVWLEVQDNLKNVRRQTYMFRGAFLDDDSEDEGAWTVAVHYEQDV